jgi:hypothetical protein
MDNVVGHEYLYQILTEAGFVFPKHAIRGKLIIEPETIPVWELELAVVVNDQIQLNESKDGIKTETKRYKMAQESNRYKLVEDEDNG